VNQVAELLDSYAKLNHDLGSKQTYFYEIYKGRYDTLDAFELERSIKATQEKIMVARDMINEQLESEDVVI